MFPNFSMDAHKFVSVTLLVLLNSNGIIGQQQQGQQSPFGNIFGFSYPFTSFFGQSSPNNNPSSASPYIFQQYFASQYPPNPSSSPGDNSQQQGSNPTNNYPGFSLWPVGSNGVNGIFNPLQNLFGNNFPQNSNNQYANNPQQEQRQPYQNQNQYPFGFPFSNPFFPQYYQNPQPNQYPTPNQQPGRDPNSAPIGTNILPSANNNANPIQPNQGNNPIPPSDVNVRPVELAVEHSKQDTKHPSLVTPSPVAPQILDQGPQQEENLNIEEFPLNPDQQNLPPEIVDVRFEDEVKGKSNTKGSGKPSPDGALMFA